MAQLVKKKVQPAMVRQVWAMNLHEEFYHINCAIQGGFTSAAIDKEFPGTIYDPFPQQVYARLPPQQYYSVMKQNVDKLRIIQLGLTLFNAVGHHCIWQFNFCDFDRDIHPHSEKSIAFLEQQGINFARNKFEGIRSIDFAFKLRALVLPYGLTWFTFQGSYDFGLLIKIMTGRELPCDVDEFMGLVGTYFGIHTCDLKLVASLLDKHGGLEKVGNSLGLERVAGTCHQTGLDSFFTMNLYLEIRKTESYMSKFIGVNHKLYGLSTIP